jgi:hypothetical protein
MAIAVTGYTILTDTDGNVSQSVTVPTGSDYCLAFLGSDNGPTINSISIGGQAMSLLVAGGGWALTNRLYGCPVTPGTRTFSLSTASPFNYLGAPGLIFLSGVGSVRASAGNGLSAIGTLSLADIMSQADDFAIIIGAHDGYSSPGAQDVELNGQTAIFENQNVNYGGFGAAYKLATGSTTTMQMYGNWPFACAAILIPAGEPPAATLNQEGFRWRNDNGSETTATWIAAQDVD